jgi:GT2 family glycosyltransferase
MKLGAFIMTRNRPRILKATLESLLAQTRPPDYVLVVDNGPSAETEGVVLAFPESTVTYHAMPGNVGPAGAAAFALDRLSREGFDWIYWGDDDDPPGSPETLSRLMRIAETSSHDAGAVGAVGAMWDWRKGEIRRLPDEALAGIINVDTIAGNCQLIIRRDVVSTVGVPDARLFFGLEEIEYCLRIRTAGYRLLVDGDLMKECRAHAGRVGWSRPRHMLPSHAHDTLWRRYYSTRNYIFAMSRTFQRPDLARRELFKAIGRACLSWGRGAKYGFAFTMLQLRAIVDGYLGRMGRTVLPVPKLPSIDVSR